MLDQEDDESLVKPAPKVKYAGKDTNNDKATLLSSSEDDVSEEYTDIFADDVGELITSAADLDEGDSVSASDNEITGYTGDVDMYTDGNEKEDFDSDHVVIKEGTLIDLNDDTVEELGEVIEKVNEEQKLITDDSISEITNKLEEAKVSSDFEQKPGKPVKVTDLCQSVEVFGQERNVNSVVSSNTETENEDITGYLSSGEMSQQQNPTTLFKKKKHRTHTLSSSYEKETQLKKLNDELNSSTEFVDQVNSQVSNVEVMEKMRPKKGKKKKKVKLDEDHPSKDHDSHHGKLIDIESPPQTPSITLNKTKEVVNNTKDVNNDTSIVQKSKNKRKRTRHKVYLDDPDVHQLISDHVTLLHKFIEDVQSGKHLIKQQQHCERPQYGIVYGPTKDNIHSVKPSDGHNIRGKNLIARIRNDDISTSSDDEDQHNRHNPHRNVYSSNFQKHYSHEKMYDVCPDCGERHSPEDPIALQDVCPDCGVRHDNPYEHLPVTQKPWQKYVDACHDALKPGQRYQQVPTEQDPVETKTDTLPSIDGPHSAEELRTGVRYKMKYLGSSQVMTQHPVTKETRMQQAQDAYSRIKGTSGDDNDDDDDDDDDASTNVDMFISLERIKILNKDTKFEDVLMDHALRTVCFICDMGKILVLMARRLTSDHSTDFSVEQGKPISLGSIVGDREKKTSKNICHVFEGEEDASIIAKAIGQAFNIAYRDFLQSNGIAHEHVEEAEYCHVLESQKLVGADLDRLTDQQSSKDIVLVKKRGEALGIMLLESGWGSMLPTVFIAHLANYSAAARCQQLSVGDHVLSCNGSSLVGLPLSECNTILRNARSTDRVMLKVVSCPPVVDVVVSRPDVKFQLGFSVQNGTICSLLRGGIAERGGIRVGHRIIEINGDSVVAKSHQHIVDILANTIGSIGMKTMPVAMYRLMVGDDLPQHI